MKDLDAEIDILIRTHNTTGIGSLWKHFVPETPVSYALNCFANICLHIIPLYDTKKMKKYELKKLRSSQIFFIQTSLTFCYTCNFPQD